MPFIACSLCSFHVAPLPYLSIPSIKFYLFSWLRPSDSLSYRCRPSFLFLLAWSGSFHYKAVWWREFSAYQPIIFHHLPLLLGFLEFGNEELAANSGRSCHLCWLCCSKTLWCKLLVCNTVFGSSCILAVFRVPKMGLVPTPALNCYSLKTTLFYLVSSSSPLCV